MEDWADELALGVIDKLIHVPVDSLAARNIIATVLRAAARRERERIAAVIEDDLDRSKTDWEVLARSLRQREPE